MLRGNSHRSYPPSTVDNGEGTIRLALGGAVGKTTKTRAEVIITAEDNEKKVESLYAVLFKDAVVSDSDTEKEDNTADLFFKAINVTDSIYHDNDSVRFKVSSGDYQICFVANPSAGLFDNLTAGSSSVANFKALVETKAPDTKPGMLMTSDFHKATVTTNDSTLLTKTVELERAMARIDIVNKADGITIDSVKLVNRAMNSVLINDGEKKAEALADTTYKALSLAGKADGTSKYEAKIYSYEQYGTDSNAPSMEVYYRIGTKNYTHTIKFVTKGEDGAETQINFKRNNLYTVNITNNAGKLTFTLTVADWNKGTVFEVTSEELIYWMDPYNSVAVGSILLKDGTFVTEVDESNKSNVIGVVACTFTSDDTRPFYKSLCEILEEKGQERAHGLVLALNDVNNDNSSGGTAYTWSTETTTTINTSYATMKDVYESGLDGYTLSQKVLTEKSSSLSNYPAFNALKTYREGNTVPTYTTGWYIPSMGEWIDILETLGGVDLSSIKTNTDSRDTDASIFAGSASTALGNIKTKMEAVGGSAMSKAIYWSSSERTLSDGTTNAWGIHTPQNNGALYFNHYAKNQTGVYVRCVLAF